MKSILVYRVCTRREAIMQQVGQVYHLAEPPVVRSSQPGLHATLVPEYWRRILNSQMAAQGLGFRYTHTLLIEIPANTEATHEPIYGEEYRIDDLQHVLVRGVADETWPPPPWVPQPRREIDWDPGSTQFRTSVIKWQPLVSPADWRDQLLG